MLDGELGLLVPKKEKQESQRKQDRMDEAEKEETMEDQVIEPLPVAVLHLLLLVS